MPQLNLNFIEIPIPETSLWEQFDDEQKRLVVETLTRLLVKLTQTNNQVEQTQTRRRND
jgi:phenylpyruvate tautomerase PptA (4-oxalocrotonate tautomerase family)